MKRIVFVTRNNGKFREAEAKLKSIELRQCRQKYPEIQSNKLEEVVLFAMEHLEKKHPFFIEDAGLFIEALNGFPGVYSAYVFRSIGCEGILRILGDTRERRAIFKSVIAYKEPRSKPILFRGECRGRIAYEKRGSHGFGYDPIFIPQGSTKTFGEMTIDEKNSFSHRGRSLQSFLKYLEGD
jgi:XTP/dITP diphosphohydrolase